jgi:hypothetical protein
MLRPFGEVGVGLQAGAADRLAGGHGHERRLGVREPFVLPLLARGLERPVEGHVRESLGSHGAVRGCPEVSPVGDADDLDAVRDHRRPLLVEHDPHLLDLAVDLAEAEALGEGQRAGVVHVRARLRVAERVHVVGEGPQERRADAAPPGALDHPRRDEAGAHEVGLAGNARPDDGAVELREQHEAVVGGGSPKLLDRRRTLVGQHRAPHAAPCLEVGVGLRRPDVDHPERFSLPCFLA